MTEPLSRETSLSFVSVLLDDLDRAWLDLGNAYSGQQRGKAALTLTEVEREALVTAWRLLGGVRDVLTKAFVPYAKDK